MLHPPTPMPAAADSRELLRQWASGPAPAAAAPGTPAPADPAPAPGNPAPRLEAWLLLGRLLQRAGHGGPAMFHVAAVARVLLTRLTGGEQHAALHSMHKQVQQQQQQRLYGAQAGKGAGATGGDAGKGPSGEEKEEEAWRPSPERLLDLLAWCCCVAGDVLMVAQEQSTKAGAGAGAAGAGAGARPAGGRASNGRSAGGVCLQGDAGGGGAGVGAAGCSGLYDPAAALRCYRGALRLCPGNGAYEGRVRWAVRARGVLYNLRHSGLRGAMFVACFSVLLAIYASQNCQFLHRQRVVMVAKQATTL